MHVTGKWEEGSEARPESEEAYISKSLGIPSAQTLAPREADQEWSWEDTPRYGGQHLTSEGAARNNVGLVAKDHRTS